MSQWTTARFFVFGMRLLAAAFIIAASPIPEAAAQMPNICPSGQTFVVAQGKCIVDANSAACG
jgi:hypothetical protein